jgi:hypothetical protein
MSLPRHFDISGLQILATAGLSRKPHTVPFALPPVRARPLFVLYFRMTELTDSYYHGKCARRVAGVSAEH